MGCLGTFKKLSLYKRRRRRQHEQPSQPHTPSPQLVTPRPEPAHDPSTLPPGAHPNPRAATTTSSPTPPSVHPTAGSACSACSALATLAFVTRDVGAPPANPATVPTEPTSAAVVSGDGTQGESTHAEQSSGIQDTSVGVDTAQGELKCSNSVAEDPVVGESPQESKSQGSAVEEPAVSDDRTGDENECQCGVRQATAVEDKGDESMSALPDVQSTARAVEESHPPAVPDRVQLPHDILYMVIRHLGDDRDKRARSALATMMLTSRGAYRAAACVLYDTITLGRDSHRLFADLPSLTTACRDRFGRLCYPCYCGTKGVPSASPARAPMGKLALLGLARHLVLDDLTFFGATLQYIDFKIGSRKTYGQGYINGGHVLKQWDRGPLFRGVHTVTITPRGYFSLKELNRFFPFGSTGLNNPAGAFFREDVHPTRLVITPPTGFDVFRYDRDPHSCSSGAKRFPKNMDRYMNGYYYCDWVTELVSHWPLQERPHPPGAEASDA